MSRDLASAGCDAAVGGEAGQALEDVGIDHFVDRGGGFRGGVEAGRLEHEADLHIGPRLRERRGHRGGHCKGTGNGQRDQ